MNIDKINGYGLSFYSTDNSVNDEIQYRSTENLTNVYEIYKGKERLYQTFSNGNYWMEISIFMVICVVILIKLLSEQSIQMINFRFNTAQRELSSNQTNQQLTPPLQTPRWWWTTTNVNNR